MGWSRRHTASAAEECGGGQEGGEHGGLGDGGKDDGAGFVGETGGEDELAGVVEVGAEAVLAAAVWVEVEPLDGAEVAVAEVKLLAGGGDELELAVGVGDVDGPVRDIERIRAGDECGEGDLATVVDADLFEGGLFLPAAERVKGEDGAGDARRRLAVAGDKLDLAGRAGPDAPVVAGLGVVGASEACREGDSAGGVDAGRTRRGVGVGAGVIDLASEGGVGAGSGIAGAGDELEVGG